MATEQSGSAGTHLNGLLQEAGMPALEPGQTSQFVKYLSLFVRWNARINLSSVREPEEILSRHLLESIVCARALPERISTLLDFGSGGGLPGIPIAICRPDLAITLAESQGKKAAFLQEAVRVLGIRATVFGGRAQSLSVQFDCVSMRAVDKMAEAVKDASALVAPDGWLALMTTNVDLPRLVQSAGAEFSWPRNHALPGSADRLLALARRGVSLQA